MRPAAGAIKALLPIAGETLSGRIIRLCYAGGLRGRWWCSVRCTEKKNRGSAASGGRGRLESRPVSRDVVFGPGGAAGAVYARKAAADAYCWLVDVPLVTLATVQ